MSNVCSTPNCGAEYESGRGGVVGPPALCPKCYMRARRQIPLDQRDRAPAGEGEQVSLRCSSDELRGWERAAKRAKVSLRVWARNALNAKAAGPGKPAKP